MKYVPPMLSIHWMGILKWVVIFPYAEHAWKLVTRWLSMRENWLLEGWACAKNGLLYGWAYAKIGSLLPEHAKKLLTGWQRKCKNSFQRIFKIFPLFRLSLIPCPLLPSLSNVLCPPSHAFVLCLLSYVPCLTSLLLVSRPLAYISVPCLSSAVPSPGPLFLVSHHLSPVSQFCSLSPVFFTCLTLSVPCLPSSFLRPLTPINCPSVPFSAALLHCSCPLLLCFPPSVPPSLVLCPLFFILARMWVLKNIHAYTCSRHFWWLATSWCCKSGYWLSLESGLMYVARSALTGWGAGKIRWKSPRLSL